MAALSTKLKRARKKMGLNPFQAALRTQSVGRQTLVNLEDGVSDPHRVPVQTAAELVELYWPNIVLADFAPDVKLKFERKK